MTTADATREGVSQDDSARAEDQVPTQPQDAKDEEVLSEREQMMEDIAARSAAERQAESEEQPGPKQGDDGQSSDEGEGGEGDESDQPGDKPERAAEQPDGEGQQDKQPPADKAPAQERKPVDLKEDDLVAMKVNGKTVMRPWKEVRAASQKVAAADERFEQASNMTKQADQTLEEATRLRREAEELSGKRGDQPAPDENTEDDDQLKELVRTVQYGDEDEAAEAMKKIVQMGRGQETAAPLSEEEIASRVAASIESKQRYEADLQTFAGEFEDIVADQRLAQMAAQEVHHVRAEDLMSIGYTQDQVSKMPLAEIMQRHRHHQQDGAVRAEIDLFREAGTRTQTWIGSKANPKPEQQPANTLEEKREIKRSMPSTPPAAGARAPAKQPEQAQTRTSVLDEMRAARAQQD